MKTRAAVQAGAPRAEPARNGAAPPVHETADSSLLFDIADRGTMVGRRAELSRLRSIWHTAASGSSRLVLVAGDAGVGKSRLAAELAGIAGTSGGLVLVGRCSTSGDRPYEPFLQALGPALAQRSDGWLRNHVKRHGPGLVRLFPELAARLRDWPDGHGQAQQGCAQPQLIAAVTAALAGSGKEPVLLVVEDLQWATRSTILILEHIARNRPPGPIMVVGTYRDAAIHPSHPMAELLHGMGPRRVDQIVLANLSPQAVSALLVDRAAVAGRAASNLARSLWLRTEGNPLLLTEALREIMAGGGLATGVVNGDAVDRIGVPHEVGVLVARRLGRPAGSARRAVEMASVLGRSFSVEAVAAAGEMEEKTARSGLSKALEAGVLLPEPGQPSRYRFTHECIRDAAYECLTPSRRVRAHRTVADVLRRPEWPETVPPSVLLHHLAAATPVGRSPDAAEQAQRAGLAAMEMLAYDEAAGFYGQALAFLGSGADEGRRADLLLLLAEAHHRSGESARARQSYLQTSALARAADDGPRLGRAVLGLGDVLGVWGADGVLIGLLEEAIEACPDDASLRAKLLARLAQARAAMDTPDERKQQSDRAWELAWDSRDPETMAAVLRARHEALSAPDDLEDRVEMDGELFAMATNAKDADLALLAHAWRLVDLLEQGHLVDAERDRKAHALLARRSGDPRRERDAAVWAATWAVLAGKPRKAATQIDRALALGQQARDPQASAIYWQQQFGLVLEWGSEVEAEGLIEVWRDLVRTHDRNPAWRAPLALLLARFGHAEETGLELDDLLADDAADLPLDRTWLPTVAAIGEVAALLEDPRCELVGKMLWPYGRRLIVHGQGLVCRGSVARVLGLLSAARGDWLAAERQFQAAVSAHERIDAGPLLARTRSDFGRALARKPGGPLHVGRARQMIDQAREEARAFGMDRLADEATAAHASLA